MRRYIHATPSKVPPIEYMRHQWEQVGCESIFEERGEGLLDKETGGPISFD